MLLIELRTDLIWHDIFCLSVILVLLAIPFLYGYHTAEINNYPMYNDTDDDGEYDMVVEMSPVDCFEEYDRVSNPELICPKKEIYQRVDHGMYIMVFGGLIGIVCLTLGAMLSELYSRYIVTEVGSG